ncbi:right-handed parallel beta-helix repeat-containing protein [Cryobacterium sp. N19]|uniref:right-handed parallel beta-helix repeat-containing protein n=1 Tax=Cryobacterium sp. N19 TaxID=2048288 RepID=UPI000CE2EFF1|nr:right-handed parallel beta-helix repeat-containing protein [Cryobacterium sp. N19]
MSVRRRTISIISALALGVGTFTAGALPAAADEANHYVDCSASEAGNGTEAAPWNDLAQVNAHAFHPGDQLLFLRGSTCVGTLSPDGSGASDDPFVISDYGNATERAVIDGDGAQSAVHLLNAQHIVLSNLEITNAAAPGTQRRGVHVELADYGTGTGYLLENLYIHDVFGGDLKGPNGSAAIGFTVTGSAVPTRYDDVQILNNRIDHIDRQGILIVSSPWNNRPEVGSTAPNNWLASTRVVVRGNTLTDLGGDGIVMNTTDGALVERNTVVGFQKRSAGYNAGIWPFNTDNTLVQYNDVSLGETHRDGMAYDVDQGNIGTTFQYNLSHDNAGGFFLLCNNGPGIIRNAVVRYNFSQNDAFRGVENCNGGVESANVHHNTIYIGDGVSQTVVNENNPNLRTVTFDHNIVYKEGSGTADFRLRSGGYTFKGNILIGVQNPPADTNSAKDRGVCAPGGWSAFPAVTEFRYTENAHNANFEALRGSADLSRFFGAESTASAPSGLQMAQQKC